MPEESKKVKFRAICKKGDYKGPWRKSRDTATQDALNHGNMPGNEDHIVKIKERHTIIREVDKSQ